MNNMPILTLMIVIPLLGALAVMLIPEAQAKLAKWFALGVSLLVFVMMVAIATQFKADSPDQFQFVDSFTWIKAFGVSFSLGVDGIALVLIALSVILVPLVIIAGWNDADDNPHASVRGYFALILALEACMIGVFAAIDVFLFYFIFEAMLLPVYFLIGRYGGQNRQYASMKFLIYSLVGGLFMLASLIGLYVVAGKELGAGTFDFQTLTQLHIDPGTQKLLFLGFFLAFAIKAPLVPFHTWLPDAAAASTPATAVLLVGVLDKVGTFGMLRLCLPLFPEASRYFAPLVIVLSVVGIIYGALLAIGQTDLKRLIAYTSISHFGFIGLGIFAMTTQGQSGSTFYMFNHGLSTGALFLLAGFLMTRRGSNLIPSFGGINTVAPVLTGMFLIAGLSSMGLPGMSSFVSEFLVLAGAFAKYKVAAIIATTGIILAAIYILLMFQRMMTGPIKAGCEKVGEINKRELVAIVPLVLLIIGLGFYPKPALDVINPAVDRVLTKVGQVDPQPAIAGVTQTPVEQPAVTSTAPATSASEGAL